jgi:deacetoxycephalosporin-C synthase
MTAMADAALPQFSLLALEQNQCRSKLLECLSTKGFFYLTDYGMADVDHLLAREAALEFFHHATDAEWESVASDDPTVRRGFLKLEAESTARVMNSGDYSDYAMSYSMGLSNNIFPSRHFERVWTAYFSDFYQVAQRTARKVLEVAGLEPECDLDALLDCDPVFRFRYFPEVPPGRCAESQPFRMASHYDISVLTLVHQMPCENGFVSLQWDRNGTRVGLPARENSVLVFCGAVSTLLTGGRVKAPRHHVAAPAIDQRVGSSRTSGVFFLRPNPDLRLPMRVARACGFNTDLPGDFATFQDWIGENYVKLRTLAPASHQ